MGECGWEKWQRRGTHTSQSFLLTRTRATRSILPSWHNLGGRSQDALLANIGSLENVERVVVVVVVGGVDIYLGSKCCRIWGGWESRWSKVDLITWAEREAAAAAVPVQVDSGACFGGRWLEGRLHQIALAVVGATTVRNHWKRAGVFPLIEQVQRACEDPRLPTRHFELSQPTIFCCLYK